VVKIILTLYLSLFSNALIDFSNYGLQEPTTATLSGWIGSGVTRVTWRKRTLTCRSVREFSGNFCIFKVEFKYFLHYFCVFMHLMCSSFFYAFIFYAYNGT